MARSMKSALAAALLASCAAPAELAPRGSEATKSAAIVGLEDAPSAEDVRRVIEAEAQRLYGDECGRVIVPSRAVVPVEFTGGE